MRILNKEKKTKVEISALEVVAEETCGSCEDPHWEAVMLQHCCRATGRIPALLRIAMGGIAHSPTSAHQRLLRSRAEHDAELTNVSVGGKSLGFLLLAAKGRTCHQPPCCSSCSPVLRSSPSPLLSKAEASHGYSLMFFYKETF